MSAYSEQVDEMDICNYLRYWGNDGNMMFDYPTLTRRMREASEEILAMAKQLGYRDNCVECLGVFPQSCTEHSRILHLTKAAAFYRSAAMSGEKVTGEEF
jgi:hypothetical protein